MSVYGYKTNRGKKWAYALQFQKRPFRKAGFLTKGKAKIAELQLKEDLEKKLDLIEQNEILFSDLCITRLKYLKGNKSTQYWKNNRRSFVHFMRFLEDDEILCSEISSRSVYNFLQFESDRLSEEHKDNHLVNQHIRHLKALFNFGKKGGRFLERTFQNPVEDQEFYDIEQRQKYIPPDTDIQEVRRLLQPHQKRFFDFLRDTGARSSSALMCIAEDFKDNDSLFIRTRKKRGGLRLYKIKPPKNWRELIAGKRNDERMFPEWSDYPRFVEKACKKIQKKNSNFRIFTLHALRHRLASRMNKQGKTVFDIKEQLGHEGIETTQEYLQLLP